MLNLVTLAPMRPSRAARASAPRSTTRSTASSSFDSLPGREYAENIGVARIFALRPRTANRDCGRCANRAPDLPVDATAPDRRGAEDDNLILKGFPREVDYITEQPQQFPVRIEAEQQGGTHTIDVVGALHSELQPLVRPDALARSMTSPASWQAEHPGAAAEARQVRRCTQLSVLDAGELHHGRQQRGAALSAW